MVPTDLRALARRFDVPGALSVKAEGGAGVIVIETPAASAKIALQGAHLLSWTPAGEADAVWLSPLTGIGTGKAIRGGIPVCWPWFGPHPSDTSAPSHGFARNVDWELTAAEHIGDVMRVVLELPPSDLQRRHGFEALGLTLAFEIGGELSLALTSENRGAAPITITEALHTYFQTADVKKIRIEGLDGASYLDNSEGGKRKSQSGPISIDREIVRIFDETTSPVTLTDPGLARRIEIRKSGSDATIVWNPWTRAGTSSFTDIPSGDFAKFVCVESGNAGGRAVTIPPGGRHVLATRYGITRA